MEEKIQKGKEKTGRYGMELWHILVLSGGEMEIGKGFNLKNNLITDKGDNGGRDGKERVIFDAEHQR